MLARASAPTIRCTSAPEPHKQRRQVQQRVQRLLQDAERVRAARLRRTAADLARGARSADGVARELLASELRDVAELVQRLATELTHTAADSSTDDDYDAGL